MIIYKATNTINGKCYVGQTIKTLKKRQQGHKTNSKQFPNNKSHFHRAIHKHGWDNFIWEILYECDDLDELNEKEKFYIKHHNTFEEGYNLTTGGYNCMLSEECKRKTGDKHRGKTISKEMRQKLSKSLNRETSLSASRPSEENGQVKTKNL